MTCLRCIKARRALAEAAKAAMKGDVVKAISEAIEAGGEIKAKIVDKKRARVSSPAAE